MHNELREVSLWADDGDDMERIMKSGTTAAMSYASRAVARVLAVATLRLMGP